MIKHNGAHYELFECFVMWFMWLFEMWFLCPGLGFRAFFVGMMQYG